MKRGASLKEQLSRSPRWAAWVEVNGLRRTPTQEDLDVIAWIIEQAPNPNAQDIVWWGRRLKADPAWQERDWFRPAFWIQFSATTHESDLMWRASTWLAIDDFTFSFVLPWIEIERLIFAEKPNPYADDDVDNLRRMIQGFWDGVGLMDNEETTLRWHHRDPRRRRGRSDQGPRGWWQRLVGQGGSA